MTAKQAKAFLVQQTAEQAAIEGIDLSDLERRMMSFTESDPESCANPVQLNAEFEALCDNAEYETKIASLLHHAYKRLRTDNPEQADHWDEAILTLSRGDHYLSVLWRIKPPVENKFRDRLLLLLVASLVIAILLVTVFLTSK